MTTRAPLRFSCRVVLRTANFSWASSQALRIRSRIMLATLIATGSSAKLISPSCQSSRIIRTTTTTNSTMK